MSELSRRRLPGTTALTVFEAAARHESFTRAAEELALTQSAICRQIGALEDFLGVRLFRRTRRGVQLTEAGLSYSRQIAPRLDAIEHDTLAVMAHHGAGSVLELAVVPTFATRWLLPRLADFQAKNADVVVNMHTQTRPFLFDQTEFDAAIYFGDTGWPGTEAHFLMREYPVPVCSPALPGVREQMSPDEVAALPLLQQTTRPYAWRQWFASLVLQVEGDLRGPRYELFSMLAVAATHGMGVALIPPFLIQRELDAGLLVPAHPAALLSSDRAYRLMIPERKVESAALRAFRDWLLQAAREYRGA